jgi:23S rRNA pseudouridine1911/1915/1917 synthase
LGFVHPTTGNYVQFESEMPEDLKAVLQKWEGYTASTGLDLDEI